MFRVVPILALWAPLSFYGLAQETQKGYYSRAASPIWERLAGSAVPLSVSSPNQRSRVTAHYIESPNGDEHVLLDVSGAVGKMQLDIGPGIDSELLWAPDSRAFFVTTSDEGANGSYHLLVVDVFDGKLQSKEIAALIYREFGQPFRCVTPELPNVAGIGWVENSHHVWVAADVVNHSNCDSSGTFKAYEVDPAKMAVEQTLDQLSAKHQLSSMLGKELRDAPDRCIRNPKSCYVSTNHPKPALQP
jgi:hypothetical protein